MPKRADRASTTDSTDESGSTGGVAGVEERGAFAVARGERCGWQGSARRSRERARKDLKQHLEDKPKHADHVSLADIPR